MSVLRRTLSARREGWDPTPYCRFTIVPKLWQAYGMKRPIFVRELTDGERQALEAGLRSSEAFVLRRAQILR